MPPANRAKDNVIPPVVGQSLEVAPAELFSGTLDITPSRDRNLTQHTTTKPIAINMNVIEMILLAVA
jgi:hypothetical protein